MDGFKIVLNNELVKFVLKGGRNENISETLKDKKDKHGLNFELNRIRKWFKEHPRAMKFASKLLIEQKYQGKNIQTIFDVFLERSEPFQVQMLEGKPFLSGCENFTRRKETEDGIIETVEVEKELVAV